MLLRAHPVELGRQAAALWMLCSLGALAWAANGGALPLVNEAGSVAAPHVTPYAAPYAPEQLRDFDIPAQPLDAALKRYAILSNWPTLFQSTMVAGRTSSAVRGSYTPEAALRRLLDGTGLAAEKVNTGPADAFILKEIDPSTLRPPAGGVDFNYGGWVQARIRAALCADPRTAAENYRALLRFQIDAAGRVRQARLLNSTGDAVRDAALLETLQHVDVERAPPPDMAQPLTMIVLPVEAGDPDAGQRCANTNKKARP